MAREPLGITYIVPSGQEATGIYEDASGVDVFLSDAPYVAGGGVQSPLPVKLADAGSVFFDSMGNARRALAVLSVPDDPDDIPLGSVTVGGDPVVYQGDFVVYAG